MPVLQGRHSSAKGSKMTAFFCAICQTARQGIAVLPGCHFHGCYAVSLPDPEFSFAQRSSAAEGVDRAECREKRKNSAEQDKGNAFAGGGGIAAGRRGRTDREGGGGAHLRVVRRDDEGHGQGVIAVFQTFASLQAVAGLPMRTSSSVISRSILSGSLSLPHMLLGKSICNR